MRCTRWFIKDVLDLRLLQGRVESEESSTHSGRFLSPHTQSEQVNPLQGNEPEEWKREWFLRAQDLIDQHQPDLYYEDGGIPFGLWGRSLVAHYQNQSLHRHSGRFDVVYTGKRRSESASGACVLDEKQLPPTSPVRLRRNRTDLPLGDHVATAESGWKQQQSFLNVGARWRRFTIWFTRAALTCPSRASSAMSSMAPFSSICSRRNASASRRLIRGTRPGTAAGAAAGRSAKRCKTIRPWRARTRSIEKVISVVSCCSTRTEPVGGDEIIVSWVDLLAEEEEEIAAAAAAG